MPDFQTFIAPAKINLQLSVGAKGDDGYHDLATVFQAVSLYDEISVRPGESGSGITLRFTGDNPHIANLPTNNKNLAYKAAQLFAQRKKSISNWTLGFERTQRGRA